MLLTSRLPDKVPTATVDQITATLTLPWLLSLDSPATHDCDAAYRVLSNAIDIGTLRQAWQALKVPASHVITCLFLGTRLPLLAPPSIISTMLCRMLGHDRRPLVRAAAAKAIPFFLVTARKAGWVDTGGTFQQFRGLLHQRLQNEAAVEVGPQPAHPLVCCLQPCFFSLQLCLCVACPAVCVAASLSSRLFSGWLPACRPVIGQEGARGFGWASVLHPPGWRVRHRTRAPFPPCHCGRHDHRPGRHLFMRGGEGGSGGGQAQLPCPSSAA